MSSTHADYMGVATCGQPVTRQGFGVHLTVGLVGRKLVKKKNILENLVKRSLEINIPADVFSFAIEIYQAAASLRIPGSGIPAPYPDKPGYYLTDIPFNRGMLAVMKETSHLSDEIRKALGMRIMHFSEAMELAQKDKRFSTHIIAQDDGSLNVSRAFQDSYAACRFLIKKKRVSPDMNHLWDLIQQHPEKD